MVSDLVSGGEKRHLRELVIPAFGLLNRGYVNVVSVQHCQQPIQTRPHRIDVPGNEPHAVDGSYYGEVVVTSGGPDDWEPDDRASNERGPEKRVHGARGSGFSAPRPTGSGNRRTGTNRPDPRKSANQKPVNQDPAAWHPAARSPAAWDPTNRDPADRAQRRRDRESRYLADREAARQLRERARRAVRAQSPPTELIVRPRQSSGLSADVERSVLDLLLRAGDALIATGAPVADVTAALLKLADGFGVRSVQIDITFTSITASIDREDEPITGVRVIAVRTSDYSRLANLFQLVDDSAAGKLDLATAHRRLTEIAEAPHPYRRWIVTVALGAMAAGLAVLLGGGPLAAFVAGGTTAIIDRTLRRLRAWGLPSFFQQTVGGIIVTVIALALLWGQERFEWDTSLLPPSVVVASGIVVLLAGLSLVGSAEDAISEIGRASCRARVPSEVVAARIDKKDC